MISILIVEDNADKYKSICSEILKVEGIDSDNIFYAADIVTAKRFLKERKFSLLLLDLNLPNRMGGNEEKMSGIKILDFINMNVRAIRPSYILGMTAFDESLTKAQEEFSSIIWQVIKFEHSSSAWKGHLRSSINYLIANDTPPYRNDGKTYHTDVGIVCALEEELEAVLEQADSYDKFELQYDQNIYFKVTYNTSEGPINAVAVSCPNMGISTSAVLTQHVISTFRPRIIAMAGICAGIRDKTNFGDVLIAEPCFEWGGGKIVENSNNELELKSAPYPWRIDSTVQNILKNIKSDVQFLEQIYRAYDKQRPASKPSVKIDAMASGASVLQSQTMLDFVKKQHKNLIGIEMESYAVFTACALSNEPKPLCVSIKSVCDFGDATKADDYHHYAAFTSASVLTRFIKDWFSKNS